MLKTLNTAATGMRAQQTNMDVVSNNIANVNTTGFKRSRAEFEDLLYQNIKEPGAKVGETTISPTGVQTGMGVRTSSVAKDFELGAAKVTRNPLDLQIEGDGFFVVQLPDGQQAYTRDGSFKKDPQGKIVDRNGHALIPEIVLPPNSQAVSITSSGEVSVMVPGQLESQVVGQIEVASFVNPVGLKALGKNLFSTTVASGNPILGQPGTQNLGEVSQGQLEGSNVNIAESMIDMISAQRSYETNSKVIQAADQMLQSTNNLR